MGDRQLHAVWFADCVKNPRAATAGMAALAGSLIALQLGNGVAVGLIEAVGPGIATCLRVGIGAVLTLPAFWLARNSTPVSWRRLVIYGAVLGLMQLSFYQAISHITLSLAVSIEFVVPLAIGCMRSRSWVVRLPACGAVAGLFLIVDYTGQVGLPGILWALATGVLLSIYIRVGTSMPAGSHPLAVLSKALWVALPVVLVGQLFIPMPALRWTESLAGQAIVVSILTMVVPFSLELFAMKRLRALPFALVSALDPALASAVGVFGLNQYLDSKQISGLIVLTGCAALAVWSDGRLRTNYEALREKQGVGS